MEGCVCDLRKYQFVLSSQVFTFTKHLKGCRCWMLLAGQLGKGFRLGMEQVCGNLMGVARTEHVTAIFIDVCFHKVTIVTTYSLTPVSNVCRRYRRQ